MSDASAADARKATLQGARKATVLQGGRAKAYRPLPEAQRRQAFRAGVAAYERGEFFEAHELLEPAWMGTDDLVERLLHQGLIKLAAAGVHAERGNPMGVEKNLRGARERLAEAMALRDDGTGGGGAAASVVEAVVGAETVDVPHLLAQIESRLAGLAALAAAGSPLAYDPPVLRRTRR